MPPASWADDLQISPLLLDILWRRGLNDFRNLDNYLAGRLDRLTHPSQWPLIPEAANFMVSELLKGKKIAIWGDYDVDGITSTALSMDILEAHGFSPLFHLPNRLNEGYGLNVAAIEELAKEGCGILYTVDCGISNVEAIKRANELGISVIVSDHHLPPEELPPARYIVDPRMEIESEWPCEHLAGVGVAFYLMGAVNTLLSRHTGKHYKMDGVLDLVALGTLADVMRVEGENRILVRAGLAKMTKPERAGIAALKSVSKFDIGSEVNSWQAIFRLAPRINAAGRMGDPTLALELLRCENYSNALELASKLNEMNAERINEEKRILSEARNQAEELLATKKYAALVLYGEDWHQGIIGIVASKIVEEFNRPTIILCNGRECLKGSGRSVADFDLHGGLAKTSSFLLGYGGHKMAAGLSMKYENMGDFREAFSDAARAELGPEPTLPVLELDRELDFASAGDINFARELQLMQPFGPGNSEPVFSSPPVEITGRRPLGHDNLHVQLDLKDLSTGRELSAKAWRMAEAFPPSIKGEIVRLAYTPRIDTWSGRPEIDLDIKDWRKDFTYTA